MSEIHFVWDMTDGNFRRMMAEEETSAPFGVLYFGDYLIKFDRSYDGLHRPNANVFQYGVGSPDGFELYDGTKYKPLDCAIPVPKRRTPAAFKRAVENIIMEMIKIDPEMHEEYAFKRTRTFAEWHPSKICGTTRIPTQLGDIVIGNKGYGPDDEYPGVYVGIEMNGELFDIAMIEVDQEDEPALLKCHVYSADPEQDEPIFDYTTDADEIGKYFEALR